MQNSHTLSEMYDYFQFDLIPNYDAFNKNKEEVDNFINSLVV